MMSALQLLPQHGGWQPHGDQLPAALQTQRYVQRRVRHPLPPMHFCHILRRYVRRCALYLFACVLSLCTLLDLDEDGSLNVGSPCARRFAAG
jgi:hypothetical protein